MIFWTAHQSGQARKRPGPSCEPGSESPRHVRAFNGHALILPALWARISEPPWRGSMGPKRRSAQHVARTVRDRLIRLAATPYQPVDAKANRKNWKAGADDRARGSVITAPLVVVVASLLILVKCGRNQNC